MDLPERKIHCEDALPWLKKNTPLTGCSLITSLPDASEFQDLTFEAWKEWFIKAAKLVLLATPDSGVAIFYQTDLKRNGAWVDKSFLIQKAAESTGHALLWRKAVCRIRPGEVAFGKPAYSHLLCFSKSVRAEVSRSTADVLPHAGAVTWTRGMGIEACRVACRFVLKNTATHTIVDPFCCHGSVLAVANEMGLNAIGVEIGGKRARRAAKFQLSELLS